MRISNHTVNYGTSTRKLYRESTYDDTYLSRNTEENTRKKTLHSGDFQLQATISTNKISDIICTYPVD